MQQIDQINHININKIGSAVHQMRQKRHQQTAEHAYHHTDHPVHRLVELHQRIDLSLILIPQRFIEGKDNRGTDPQIRQRKDAEHIGIQAADTEILHTQFSYENRPAYETAQCGNDLIQHLS